MDDGAEGAHEGGDGRSDVGRRECDAVDGVECSALGRARLPRTDLACTRCLRSCAQSCLAVGTHLSCARLEGPGDRRRCRERACEVRRAPLHLRAAPEHGLCDAVRECRPAPSLCSCLFCSYHSCNM